MRPAPVLTLRRPAMRPPRAVRRVGPPSPRSEVDFEAELRKAKLDALKELAYGASHEINNPLANIALRAQTLLKRERDAEKRKALEAMHRAAMRAHEMISDLMLFARPPRAEPESIDLRDVARRAIEHLGSTAEADGCDLVATERSTPITAFADPAPIGVAVRAAIQNGIDAVGSGGRVVVEALECAGQPSLRVSDNGPGLSPEACRHAFDPFFSGREAGRGLGFGLAKCWRIVTDHGGSVSLDSPVSGGAVLTITLPRPVDDGSP
ncbi:MAG: HAMP domain-containing sensor histidine kinase [Planctomycetota bacterium]